MILDEDEKILKTNTLVSKSLQCVDLFVKNFTINLTEYRSSSYPLFYDAKKIYRFYNSKESKFRKMIKAEDMKVVIWTHENIFEYSSIHDNKTYSFYYENELLFRLILWFKDKNESHNTYGSLEYEIRVDDYCIDKTLPKELLQKQLARL